MAIFNQFEEITLTPALKEHALYHACKRTEMIKRQFVPQNAPLTPLESNYAGVIGEIAVRKFLGLSTKLDDNYEEREVDNGDIEWDSLIYDVKTDAIPTIIYNKLYNGLIKEYDTYGCRVFSAKHLHHLKKYSGGLIFCAFKIPDGAKDTKPSFEPDHSKKNMRKTVFTNNEVLIVGLIEQKKVADEAPTWYTPINPETGKQSQYNSPNYIFHHKKLKSIKTIL